MSDMNGNGAPKDDPFLSEMETAVRAILKGKKVSKSDKLAAIKAGIQLAAIKHKISGGDPEAGFFDK